MHEYKEDGLTKKCAICLMPDSAPQHVSRMNLNPSDEKLREVIAEKDRIIETLKSQVQFDNLKLADLIAEKDAEIARLKQDAERYRILKPLFHKSIVMANGRRWWDCHLAASPEIETLDQVIDQMPGGRS